VIWDPDGQWVVLPCEGKAFQQQYLLWSTSSVSSKAWYSFSNEVIWKDFHLYSIQSRCKGVSLFMKPPLKELSSNAVSVKEVYLFLFRTLLNVFSSYLLYLSSWLRLEFPSSGPNKPLKNFLSQFASEK